MRLDRALNLAPEVSYSTAHRARVCSYMGRSTMKVLSSVGIQLSFIA